MEFQDILRRIQGEFLEMPGLRLSAVQAQRLWNLDPLICEALLGALVDAHFLVRMRDGAFIRADWMQSHHIDLTLRSAGIRTASKASPGRTLYLESIPFPAAVQPGE